MYTTWSCSLPGGGTAEELALSHDKGRPYRLLVIPPLFDEANKMRRFLAEIMYRFDLSGIDSFLPDLPGWNESMQPLAQQSLKSWRIAMAQIVAEFRSTHCLAVRSGALLAPNDLQGWNYAPQSGKQLLRNMLRARVLASKEVGRQETTDNLLEEGHRGGLTLGGRALGADMVKQLQNAVTPADPSKRLVEQTDLGGAGLWLRAEPDEDHEQADALAAVVAIGMMASRT